MEKASPLMLSTDEVYRNGLGSQEKWLNCYCSSQRHFK